MNITGLITEYNPFHLGHKYHLENSIKDSNSTGTICIMSGNFIQRGFPALIDKWNRAEIAVKNGVDLVIELPLIYATSSAENFSSGAIKILNSLGVVDNIYFGSENGNINDLKIIAETLVNEDNNFKNILKEELNKGLPFHKAREIALHTSLPNLEDKSILDNSNNILGIEYLKALIKLDSNITPMTIKRVGANYNEENISTSFPSATAIRKALSCNESINSIKESLPNATYDILNNLLENNYKFIFNNDIFPYLKYKLITQGHKLKNLHEVKEGLDNKILKEITTSNNLDDLIMKVKSKRYTYTRISRILLSFFIGLEDYNIKDLLNTTPSYIRPLAFNENGRNILKEIKKAGNVNIITKVPKLIEDPILALDILGTKAYSILNPCISPYEDYTHQIKLIKNQ